MTEVIKLYRTFLKKAKLFKDYNMRSYIERCVKEDFHKYKNEKNPETLEKLLEKAKENLAIIERQGIISQLYQSKPSIITKF